MKKIPLTQGKEALVDDKDFERLSEYKWFAVQKGSTGDLWYAATQISRPYPGRKQKTLYMHHLLLPLKNDLMTDHVNGNGLDNRGLNLRRCTRHENEANSVKRVNSSSRFKGVSWHKRIKKWAAVIRVNWKLFTIGYFDSEEGAAKAYDERAYKERREFAKLNFPRVTTDSRIARKG